jgi:hypothetical protein
MRDLGHSTIVLGVNVESTPTSATVLDEYHIDQNNLPVRLMIHGHHIALLDNTVLLGQIFLRKGLWSVSMRSRSSDEAEIMADNAASLKVDSQSR